MGDTQAAESGTGFLDLSQTAGGADVGRSREEMRRKRLTRIVVLVGVPTAFLWYRIVAGNPVDLFNVPSVDPLLLIPSLFFFAPGAAARRAVRGVRPFAPPGDPARADRRPTGRRRGDRRRQGRGRPLAAAVPVAPQLRPRDGWTAASRPAVRGRPRHRQDLHREGAGRRGRRPVPVRHRHLLPVQLPGSDLAQGAPVLQGAAQGGPQARRSGRLHRRVRRDRSGAQRDVGHDCRAVRRRDADVLRRPRGPADAPVRRDDHHAVRRWRRPADGGQRAARADAVVRGADRDREAARQAGRRAEPAAAGAPPAPRPARGSTPTSC